MPAASGVPTTAVIIGDYSDGKRCACWFGGERNSRNLLGEKCLLVQKTVSGRYLFDRAMTIGGMRCGCRESSAREQLRTRI